MHMFHEEVLSDYQDSIVPSKDRYKREHLTKEMSKIIEGSEIYDATMKFFKY